MKKIFALIILTLMLIVHYQLSTPIYAQDTEFSVNIKQDKGFGIEALTGGVDQKNLVGNIFRNVIILFFTVGAIGFTIMIVWGAVDWILSGGDKEKVAAARKRIITAITGLVILSLSFTIMNVVGQILNIQALRMGDFKLPGLGDAPTP